jgi:hypothetical protein
VVTPSSKEATGSMIEAYPTGALTGACDRSWVGIAVTYAAGRQSDRRGIIHRERLTTIASRNVSQMDIVDLILSKI